MNKARNMPPVAGTEHATSPKRPSKWLVPLWWLNIGAALALAVTYLAPHVSPVYTWVPALLAMTYPYQLLLHVGFLGWWFLTRRKRMLLSGTLLALGFAHIGDHVQVFGRQEPTVAVSDRAKVMSYNVRLFDLYAWSRNKETRDAIFDLLHREDPDILCVQEYFQSTHKRFFRTKESLLSDFRFVASHERFTNKAKYDQHFGIATFSTRPIVRKGHIDFPENPENACIWSDIAFTGDTIRVYNAHLASYHFGDEDYRFIKALDTDTHTDSIRQGSGRILRLLRRGFRLRAQEVRLIAEHMRTSPHPVLYCGDMNDVPMSYGYARLRDLLDDAFVESGRGLGGTYLGDLPSLRIDHILYGEGLEAWDFRTLLEELSDHRAITTWIGLVSGTKE